MELQFKEIDSFEMFNNRVSLATTDVKGKIYVALREQYKDGEEWKPGIRGITFPIEQLGDVKTALEEVVDVDPYPENQVVLDLKRNNEHFRVTMQLYRGKEKLDLRKWYEKDGEVIPSKKGIAIPAELVELLLESLSKI